MRRLVEGTVISVIYCCGKENGARPRSSKAQKPVGLQQETKEAGLMGLRELIPKEETQITKVSRQ